MDNIIFNKIKNFFYNIKYGIKNLIIWFPYIWKDRNWDHTYIYIILKYKLHLTEQLIRNYGHHIKHIQDADKIKICINLLDRLIKDEYEESAFQKHDKKWGKGKIRFEDCKDNHKLTELHIDYPKINTPKDKEDENKEFKRAIKHSNAMYQQDIDMLFNNMRKYIQGWWD